MSNPTQDAEHKLLDLWAVHDLTPDAAEVQASRDFHIGYWLGLAESAIAGDHRQTCYGSLTPNIRGILEGLSSPLETDEETVAALRRELAFLEGHVQAYREIIEALRNIAALNRNTSPEPPPVPVQDCGSRAA